ESRPERALSSFRSRLCTPIFPQGLAPTNAERRDRGRLLITQGGAPSGPATAEDVTGLENDHRPATREAHPKLQVRRAARPRALGGVESREVEDGSHSADFAPWIAGGPHRLQE